MRRDLSAERERRGLSLADMMRLTGMSRESISRLENDPAPNPTMLTFACYAAALGLELQFSAKRGVGVAERGLRKFVERRSHSQPRIS